MNLPDSSSNSPSPSSAPAAGPGIEVQKPATPSPPDAEMIKGPKSRFSELCTLFRIMADFIRGLRVLHFVGPCVTIFGSARTKEGDPHYELARKMGGALAELGFTVMTGAGPGIMEAGNRGAQEAGGRSVGCNIKLPFEQSENAYLDRCVTMEYFFVRKTLLMKYSYAFVVMPGGAGTVDELFEALTLIQTGKLAHFPIIIMGTAYWKELLEFVEKMAREKMIGPDDLKLIYATDSIEEAIKHIRDHAIKPFGLKTMVLHNYSWLGERGLRR